MGIKFLEKVIFEENYLCNFVGLGFNELIWLNLKVFLPVVLWTGAIICVRQRACMACARGNGYYCHAGHCRVYYLKKVISGSFNFIFWLLFGRGQVKCLWVPMISAPSGRQVARSG